MNPAKESIARAGASGKRALIVGGGIGGPALALFLQRAGWDVEIYEARKAPQPYAGLFLNLASNGMRVLRELGLARDVLAEGFACPRMSMWNGKGKRLGEVPNGGPTDVQEGVPSVIIRRSALQRILMEAAVRQGIAVHYGKRLAGVQWSGESAAKRQSPGGDVGVSGALQERSGGPGHKAGVPDGGGRVQARFDDGSVADGDVLIGCDGIHSKVREFVDPAAPSPVYTGQVSCGGFAEGLSLPPTTGMQHFVFGKRAFFGYLVRETGEIYWFANVEHPGAPTRAELESTPTAEWRRRLLDLFRDDQPFIREIIHATRGEIGRYPVYELPPLARWHRGAVALLGDAAHATSPSAGQGASMALEDAIVLAKALRDMPVDHALRQYQDARKSRAERIVRFSRQRSSNKVALGPLARWMRDMMMPFFLKRMAAGEELAWLYRFDERFNNSSS